MNTANDLDIASPTGPHREIGSGEGRVLQLVLVAYLTD
jgi:hypothetical protein